MSISPNNPLYLSDNMPGTKLYPIGAEALACAPALHLALPPTLAGKRRQSESPRHLFGAVARGASARETLK